MKAKQPQTKDIKKAVDHYRNYLTDLKSHYDRCNSLHPVPKILTDLITELDNTFKELLQE